MFKFKQLRDVGLCLLLLLTTASAWSQVSAYSFTQSATTYTPITGGTVAGTGTIDDDSYSNKPIGFPFTYNGIVYTAFSLNANGQIAMGSTITYSYTPISDGSASNNMIAAYCEDLQGLSNGEMRYETIGMAPNRTLVVQFANWRHYNTTGDNVNFQIRLNETTNTVQVVYGSFVRNTTTQTTEVGLRGSSPADYNNRTSTADWAATTAGTSNSATITSTTAIIPASGLSFLWTPPSCGAPNGLNITATSATDGMVGWAALVTGIPTNGYDWEIVPSGNAQGVGVIASGNTTSNSAPFTGLASFTAYTLYVRSNCGGIQSAYTSYNFTFCGAGLPGNGLVNAIPVSGSSFTYNFPSSNWACYGNNYVGRTSPDVYFRILADSCASSITVTTCNSATNWDNYMTILASNGTTVIGFADQTCGSLAAYTFTPAAGATYYAVVEPYSSFNTPADFRLDVTQTAGTPISTLTTTAVSSTCLTSTDGSVTVSAMGGKMPFTYVWSNGVTQTLHSTSATITGLVPGTYTVSVTNGCGGTAATTATATVTSAFSFTGVTTPTSCNGTSDGAVNLTLTGATTPTFVWSNGAITEDLTGLVVGTYNVTITSGTCVSTASYAVNSPSLGIAAVSKSITCGGETVTLSLSGQSAGSPFIWQSSADGITGWTSVPDGNVTPFEVSPADTTYYRAYFCGSTPTNVVVVNAFVVNSPIAANVTRCGPGSVTVTAAGSNVSWFATPTSTTSLATGASYTTNITSTTTFYAEASGGGATNNIGPLNNAIGTGAQQQSGNYLIFDALQAFTLQSVVVYPGSTGNVVINLQTSTGTVLQTVTYNIATLPASGGVTVPLNFSVPMGTNLQLAQGTGSISMFRNDGGVTYPYTVPGYASIKDSSFDNTYYYFFYNWLITTACTSPRTAVTATVTAPPAITVTAGTPAVCTGLSTALTISSANADYTYTWAASSSLSATSGATVTATPAVGTVYAVTASDANTGCQATANVSVVVNPLPSVSASATPAAVCPGATVALNGTVASLSVGTGTVQNTTTTYPAPYGNYYYGAKHQILIRASELLAAGVNPGNINGLSFSIVSTNGVALDGFEIQMAPTALTALTTSFVSSGFTVVSPAATYTPTVGVNTHNFTTPFSWDGISNIVVQTCFNNNDDSNNAIFRQTATSYASTVWYREDDATVCSTATGTATSNQRPNMTFLTSSTYSYAWTPSAGLANAAATTTTVVPTATGTYTFAVTNTITGCSATAATTVTVFSLPTVTATSTNVLCNGAANGTATATAANGTAPYTYAWSNGGTTATITGLSGGTYTVSVTDAHNCITATASVTITEPAVPLTLDAAILTPVSCFGGSNGAIDIAISGGVAPYTYVWSTGATTQDIYALIAGAYTGTVTDANGCTLIVGPAIVTQPAAFVVTSTSTNVTCNGAANGAINVTVTGGTMPYTYAWSNGAVSEDLVNLAPNSYTCFITDANGCTTVAGPITITEPAVLAIPAVGVNDILCNGAANGGIDIDVTGGTMPYTYAWSNGATTEELVNLVPGAYLVTVTDANGCTALTGAITIIEPTALVVTADIVENVSCNGSNDGRIVVSVSGGVSPYSFVWSNGATTQNLSGLAAGTYNFTVTDANGCTAALGATTITEPTAIVATAAITNVSCNAGTNGAVDLTVTGGVPAYTYNWGNVSTEDISALIAGVYSVTITDATGCMATATATVTEPSAALQLSGLPTITNVTCNGLCNGGLSNVVIVGGTTPYNYLWEGPNGFTANTANLSNLCAGTYNGTVTDANGCIYTPPVPLNITQPDALVVTLTPIAASSSVGVTDGSVTSLVSGGTSAYTYSWSNTISTANLTGVAAGTYTVSVTDANGCITTATTTVGPPTAVVNVEGVNNFNMFPNPTGGNVSITFDLATAQNVELSIFNVNGQLVKYAESGVQSNIMFSLDLSSFTGGVYMARFTVGGETFTKQIVLVK